MSIKTTEVIYKNQTSYYYIVMTIWTELKDPIPCY